MRKEKLIWKPNHVLSGKHARSFWKSIDKAKSKKELKDILYSLAWDFQQLDNRLVELKKFVGDKNRWY